MTMIPLPLLCAASVPSASPQSPNVFIFGLGYTGKAIAHALASVHGCTVVGTSRSEAAELASEGNVVLFDATCGLSLKGREALARATHVVSTIAPTAEGLDPVLESVGSLLSAQVRSGKLRWLGYLSTTSVYGDHQGAWVEETSSTRAPQGSSGLARLSIEAAWLALAQPETGGQEQADGQACQVLSPSARAAVFRLAGIYGPGRSALDTVQRERSEGRGGARSLRDAAPEAVNPTSRVHVEDIAGSVSAALVAQVSGIFNVADHAPAPRAEVLAFCEGLLEATMSDAPAAAAAQQGTEPAAVQRNAGTGLSERSRRRGQESKRVCGDKLRREVGYRFMHPDYISGLTAIHRHRGAE